MGAGDTYCNTQTFGFLWNIQLVNGIQKFAFQNVSSIVIEPDQLITVVNTRCTSATSGGCISFITHVRDEKRHRIYRHVDHILGLKDLIMQGYQSLRGLPRARVCWSRCYRWNLIALVPDKPWLELVQDRHSEDPNLKMREIVR